MPQDATPTPSTGRPRSRAAFEFGLDREKAFRQARRHTALVRTLRFVLPAVAVLMCVGYAAFMQQILRINFGDHKIEAKNITISREQLVIVDPRYSGFDKQGGEFEVKAATAEQDHKLKGFVRLKAIDGKMRDASRVTTTVKSPRGTMDTNTNILELYERVDVVASNGMSAELTRATVHAKENRITSDEPVLVRMPSGTVRGKAMTIEQKKRQILFSGGVEASLKPHPKAATETPPAAQDLRGSQRQGDAPRSDAPIEVTASRLFIDDNTKLATFAGNVLARQAEQVMETAELEIFYDGQPPSGAGGQGLAAAADGTGRLRRLASRTDVVLTRGEERATGSAMDFDAVDNRAILKGPVAISSGPDRSATADQAEMDNENETILLTGNVVVTQQRNVLKGRRLAVDRKQGTINLSAPADGRLAKGQISALLYQGEAPAAAAKKGPAPAVPKTGWAPSGALGGMRGDPNQPIEIDADTLDVDDRKKTAVFRGRVKAVQGDYVINTEELVATYQGDGGLALGAPPPAAAPPPATGQTSPSKTSPPKTGAQLKEVIAPRRVEIVSKDGQRARGNSAVFDTKANTARLTGDVILSHGTSVTQGNCALLDMTTGLMRIIDACGFSTSGTSAKPGAASPVTKGRAQLVIIPGMLKDEQKALNDRGRSDAKAATPASGSAAVPPATPAAGGPPAPRRVPRENDLPTGFGGN